MTAQEEERRAVAYDLHDGLTQYIMASHAHLEAFKYADGTGQKEKAARELDQGLTYLKEAVTESRRVVNNLRLLALEDLGLAGSLEQLLNQEKTHTQWEEATFIHNINGRRFQSALETGVYRIAQEALTNVRKHAKAKQVRLLLLTEAVLPGNSASERLRLEVRDWGQGFVTERKLYETSGEMEHIGLQGISERVHLLGGLLKWKAFQAKARCLPRTFQFPSPAAHRVLKLREPVHERECDNFFACGCVGGRRSRHLAGRRSQYAGWDGVSSRGRGEFGTRSFDRSTPIARKRRVSVLGLTRYSYGEWRWFGRTGGI